MTEFLIQPVSVVHWTSHDTELCFLADDLPGCFWQPHIITTGTFFRAWCGRNETKVLLLPCIALWCPLCRTAAMSFLQPIMAQCWTPSQLCTYFCSGGFCFEVATAISYKLPYFQVGQQMQEDQMTNGSARICKSASSWLFLTSTSLLLGSGVWAFLIADGAHL